MQTAISLTKIFSKTPVLVFIFKVLGNILVLLNEREKTDLIKSRTEIIDLLKEYEATQHEQMHQFWMSEAEWSGKRQAQYANGVVLGKFREKDPETMRTLQKGVTDEALRLEIKISLERNIKKIQNLDELNIIQKIRLDSDTKLCEELLSYKMDDWMKKNCRWLCEEAKELTYSETRVLLYLEYAFPNYNYTKNDPYCSDINELEVEYKDIFDKQSQFHKYGIVPLGNERELLTIDPPRIYDSSINRTFFTKNVPLHLLKQISEMMSAGIIMDFSVRLVNEPGYEGRIYCEYLAEALERGKVFDFVNLGDYSISRLYSEQYENCMWVNIDPYNITFEEMCEDFEVHDNMIVTQVVHLEYFCEDSHVYISHLDHEYIFYAIEEYEERMKNPVKKGEAKTRLKSFKIDHSKIPFDYLCEIHRKDMNGNDLPVEHEQFLCYVLESYFKHKELLKEYFQKL